MYSANEIILGISTIICGITIIVPFIGALFMTMSVLGIIEIIYNLFKGCSFKKAFKEVITDLPGGVLGLIPGVALIVTIVELIIVLPLR